MPAPGDQHRASTATANPFEEPETHISIYTAEQIATLQARLNRFLGPEYISSREGPGGKKVHYIAANQCIQLANEVFGFNGWSSSIREIQVDYVEEIPNTGRVNMAASVIMRVTLRDGTFHEDIGFGQIDNCKSKAMAFEKTKKEATTDALKRALRNFGNVLGNCIYDKDYTSKVTKIKVKPRKFDIEDLHRHVDYAPIKQEPSETIASVSAEIEIPGRMNTTNSSTKTEVEDEFDTADFDDIDFSVTDEGHPDEVMVDHSVVSTDFAAGAGVLNSNANRMHRPNPHDRSPAIQAQQRATAPRNGLGAPHPPPQGQNVHTNARHLPANNNPSMNTKPSFAIPNTPSRNIPPLRMTQSFQNQRDQRGSVPMTLTPTHPSPASISTDPGGLPAVSTNSLTNLALDQTKSSELPPTFFSARAVITEQTKDTAAIDPKVVFNPHAESPSIRKTAGVDHSKSMRLWKDLTPQTEPPTVATLQHPVNSGVDGIRRIGMPLNTASPVANRGSYKLTIKRPHDGGGQSPARPPLNDVTTSSNIVGHPQVGPPDPKRQRIDSTTAAKPVDQ